MKLDHRLIVLDDQMLHLELCALRKNLSQFRKGASNEIILAAVVTCQRVSAHDGPVHVLGYALEEVSAVAFLEPLEDLADTFGSNGHRNVSLCWRPRITWSHRAS